MRDQRLPKYTLLVVSVGIVLAVLVLGAWVGWDYIPGTVRVGENGAPHGTGLIRHFYKAGQLETETYFRNGLPVYANWYRPDGSLVASSDYDKERGGTDYYLREDGSIRVKMPVRYYHESAHSTYPACSGFRADGTAIYYNEDGSVSHTVEFADGVKKANR